MEVIPVFDANNVLSYIKVKHCTRERERASENYITKASRVDYIFKFVAALAVGHRPMAEQHINTAR